MTNNASELLKLKQAVDSSRAEAQRLGGQLEQLLEQRGRDFGVATDEEAEQYLQELVEQEAELDQEITDGLESIKSELEWE